MCVACPVPAVSIAATQGNRPETLRRVLGCKVLRPSCAATQGNRPKTLRRVLDRVVLRPSHAGAAIVVACHDTPEIGVSAVS